LDKVLIDRAFVRIAEGLVHLRRVEGAAEKRPLLMLHLSPTSSKLLEGLMIALRSVGYDAPLLAPDTLGNGDSAPPAVPDPDIAYFADSLARLLDAMGIDKVDLWGTHTGARTACEFALQHPDRTGRVMLDGIIEYTPEMRALFKERYTPPVKPDSIGSQYLWAFNFRRNQYLYYPWFLEDEAHSLNKSIPDPDYLHMATMAVLGSLDTYHMAYQAAFAYPSQSRVAALKAPTALLKPRDGTPAINAAADAYANGDNIIAYELETAGDLAMANAIKAFMSGKSVK
jgi:pimeloyl-ACP methyl ester carboxylesterase